MLIIGRSLNERIIIKCPDGHEIVVVVTAIRKTKVRLGVDAPQTYHIRREELGDAA